MIGNKTVWVPSNNMHTVAYSTAVFLMAMFFKQKKQTVQL